MQSGYGGVSEIQQFMVDGCGSSLFSISTAAGSAAAGIHQHHHQHQHQHQHQHHHHAHQPPPPPPPAAPQFAHFQPIPATQQLFHQSHHFQLFHHQQLGIDRESAPESSTSPTRMMVGTNNGRGGGAGGGSGGGGLPSFLTAAMNFKLSVNESSGGGSRDGLNDDEGMLHGDDGSESRVHPWHREEESAIKEPFWRPLDIDYINRNNKRCKEKQLEEPTKYCKKSKDGNEQGTTSASNYKLFSELEAIYKPGGGGGSTSVGGGGGCSATNQTGSGSALTGENPLVTCTNTIPLAGEQNLNNGSDTSTGEEAAPVKKTFLHKGSSSSSTRRKRRRRQQLSSISAFLEGLVKQLMDHQEGLHKKFLEVMERRDQERSSREEAWRKQEAAKASREAAARAQERAIASSREAAIIAFLEKITGESLELPSKTQFQLSQLQSASYNEDANDVLDNNHHQIEGAFSDVLNNNIGSSSAGAVIAMDSSSNQVQFSSTRWPKAEVQALIRVRSGLETRFQEPGLKGPLWEEVSGAMAAMGYQRSAKRCKEKWENINKYFRKTKESGKKRPQHSKTCPYFYQLDQLYSNAPNKLQALPAPPIPTGADDNSGGNAGTEEQRKGGGGGGGNSELLDAIVVLSNDNQSFNYSDSLRYDEFERGDAIEASGKTVVNSGANVEDNNRDDDEVGEEEDEEDDHVGNEREGEGESEQVYAPHHHHEGTDQHHHVKQQGKELGHGDPAHFFLR